MKSVSLCIVFLIVFCARTQAQGFKGIDLYKACYGVNHHPADEGICLGYLRGFTEGYYLGMMMGQGLEKAQRHNCFPQPPNENPPDTTQVELVVKKFLVDHPNRLNEDALFLVQEALAAAFGCQRR